MFSVVLPPLRPKSDRPRPHSALADPPWSLDGSAPRRCTSPAWGPRTAERDASARTQAARTAALGEADVRLQTLHHAGLAWFLGSRILGINVGNYSTRFSIHGVIGGHRTHRKYSSFTWSQTTIALLCKGNSNRVDPKLLDRSSPAEGLTSPYLHATCAIDQPNGLTKPSPAVYI